MAKILIVIADFYEHLSALQLQGAEAALKGAANMSWEVVRVPGALEIPAAIAMAEASGKYHAYIALGVVIRGETYHFEVVSNESARGLIELSIHHKLAIGNGILTVENEAQALKRADPKALNKGGAAAEAALAMLALKHQYGAL